MCPADPKVGNMTSSKVGGGGRGIDVELGDLDLIVPLCVGSTSCFYPNVKVRVQTVWV